MADEAFALSPISARASLPSEEDYDAISQAFMETSRGRWFLGEYAKRNRNADTCMVLDAVARIEETLAAQKQAASESQLTDALAAIRRAVEEAEAAATAAVESPASEQNLAPVRKGARIIREISWRWREIGADSRICDLLDSQVRALEEACGQISSASPQAALSAAFDLIKARIAGFDDGDTGVARAPEGAVTPPSSSASDEMPAAVVETAPAVSPANATEAAIRSPTEVGVATAKAIESIAELVDVTAEPADMATEALDVTSEAAEENAEAADAYDEALLGMVALEMAAPDPADSDEPPDGVADEVHVAELPAAEPLSVAEKPEPPAAPAQPPAARPALQPSLEPAPPASLQPSLQPSLGSTLVANGIVRKPSQSRSDPLAPIRRMSQAEKIAFFS